MDAGEKRKRLDAIKNLGHFRAWRSNIGWTNAEIVAALRAHADEVAALHPGWDTPRGFRMTPIALGYAIQAIERSRSEADYLERTGRLKGKVFKFILPRLITTCLLCGKKALYRQGDEGRCFEHRYVESHYSKLRKARLRDKQTRNDLLADEKDRSLKRWQASRKYGASMKSRGRK